MTFLLLFEKISPENYFYNTVVVLDSDKENEDERLINVNRPNMQRESIVEVSNTNRPNIQGERIVEVSNVNNEENRNFNSRRGIRDSPLRLNINIPENIDDFQNLSIIHLIMMTRWKALKVRQ